MKMFSLVQGRNTPSSRYRLLQHLDTLKGEGIDTTIFYGLFGAYPPKSSILRFPWAAERLLEGLLAISKSYYYDLTFLQRGFISTINTIEPLLKKPLVLDADDAIWINHENFAKKSAQQATTIICGNYFLAEKFSTWNSSIHILPTAVDTNWFTPCSNKNLSDDKFIIGWSGSSSGFKYLYAIEQALFEVMRVNKNICLEVISNTPPQFNMLDPARVGFIQWSPEIELKHLQNFSVGIMPLLDTEWERGKCSYKMLTYMSCGIPVVVSPVGMNNEVLKLGACGFSASTLNEWKDAVLYFFEHRHLIDSIGLNGREVIEKNYSSHIISKKLGGILKNVSR
jgi:glycosyltransferase involved in cell wall biosynthesis